MHGLKTMEKNSHEVSLCFLSSHTKISLGTIISPVLEKAICRGPAGLRPEARTASASEVWCPGLTMCKECDMICVTLWWAEGFGLDEVRVWDRGRELHFKSKLESWAFVSRSTNFCNLLCPWVVWNGLVVANACSYLPCSCFWGSITVTLAYAFEKPQKWSQTCQKRKAR